MSVGEDDGWAGAVEIPSGQLATFGFDDAGQPFYLLGARTEDASIVLRLPLQRSDELFLNRQGLGETGETFLTDGRGLFLTPPRHPGHSGTSHPIDALPMQRCLAGEDGVTRAPDYRGVDVIHGFRHLSDLGGGCIMAHIEPHEVLLPAQRFRTQIVTASIVLALLSAVAAGLLARSITRPISRLRAVADALRRCEFECAEEMKKGPPEIRAFADTFMSMAQARMIPFSAAGNPDREEPAVDPARFQPNGMWSDPPRRWNEDTPERLLIRQDAMHQLEKAIADLPPNQRAVVTLHDVEGLDSAEVCNVLEISETNERVLLHRARSKLRSVLEKNLGGA